MSKGLEALKEIKCFVEQARTTHIIIDGLNVIEKELKDYEMEHTLRIRLENINYELVREKQENEKKLKALEVLRNKPHISFDLFDTLDTLEEINDYIKFMYGYNCKSVLTQEEYDLFKEISNGKR